MEDFLIQTLCGELRRRRFKLILNFTSQYVAAGKQAPGHNAQAQRGKNCVVENLSGVLFPDCVSTQLPFSWIARLLGWPLEPFAKY